MSRAFGVNLRFKKTNQIESSKLDTATGGRLEKHPAESMRVQATANVESSQCKKLAAATMDTSKSLCTLNPSYNVFLGGSCGGRTSPTTWRKEVAIPLLTENHITFFNPQVDTWTHDLIYKENKAKENSDWLLFMLETITRGIVSLVEVAYLVGAGKSVVFVLQQERVTGDLCIKEDQVSPLERDDIIDSQNLLGSIIAKHDRCQYFSVLENGLHHLVDEVSKSSSSLVQSSNGNSYTSKGEKKILNDFLQKISSVFTRPHKHNSEQTQRKRRPAKLNINSPIHRYSLGLITSDTHCGMHQNASDRLSSLGLGPANNRDTSSIYTAHGSDGSVTDSLMQCSVILVVIPSNSTACSAMCKAAYLLSRHKNIVMCIQDLKADSVDNGNTLLTQAAVADFNRARAYLRDMAAENNVTVCDTASQALDVASQRVQKCSFRTIPEV